MRIPLLLLLVLGQASAAPASPASMDHAPWPDPALLVAERGAVGAWGPGSFQNDDALDWLGTLTGGARLDPIDHAFALVEAADYVEAPDASAAVAAAEIVAALLGRPSSDLPDEAADWVAGHPGRPAASLVARASAVVLRIREDSELRDLWEEGDAGEWHGHMADLARRLVD